MRDRSRPCAPAWGQNDSALFQLCPTDVSVFQNLEVHRGMLSDRLAVEAFRSAIEESAGSARTAVDLGTGLGILAMFCGRAGIRRVFALERNRTLGLAMEIARAAGLDEEIAFIGADSRYVNLPEPADLLVSQTLGHLGYEENILATMLDARDRFLTPGGRMIPCSLELFLAPARSDQVRRRLSFWINDPYCIDMSTVYRRALDNIYVVDVQPDDLFARPDPIHTTNLYTETRRSFAASALITVDDSGTVDGLAGWFCAWLTPEIAIDTSPDNSRTHWRQCFLPLSRPMSVQPGDVIDVRIEMIAQGEAVDWFWSARRAGDSVESGPTMQGTGMASL